MHNVAYGNYLASIAISSITGIRYKLYRWSLSQHIALAS